MKQFLVFLKNCWYFRRSQFTIDWDDTDKNYTPAGPRQSGSFVMVGYLNVVCWGHYYCFFNSRASVSMSLTEREK